MQWVVKKHNDAEGGKKRENGVNSYTENVKRKKIKGRVQERSPMRKGAVVGVSPKLCWRILEKGKRCQRKTKYVTD